jgi:hypothetical protein
MLAQPTTISEAVEEFQRKATPLAAAGNLVALRALFAKSLADAVTANRDDLFEANKQMREALREILLEPSKSVKTGWFDEL